MAKRSKKNTASAAPPPVEEVPATPESTSAPEQEPEIVQEPGVSASEPATPSEPEPDAPTEMDPPAAPLPAPIDVPPPAGAEPGIVVGLNFKFAAEEWARARDACLKIALDECDSESTKENGVVWANCARHIADGIRKLQGAT